jgi:very-short-patch-repair endonuclease
MTDVVDLKPHSGASGRPGAQPLAKLAARQHGVVSHRQLLALGLGRRAIQYRVETGALNRVYLGVYVVGHAAITPHGRVMAAVLACGPGAVASHRTGGWLYDLHPPSPPRVEVTAPGRSHRGHGGVLLHQVRRLPDADRAERGGIPVTTVARTLLDLAEVLLPRQLERVVEEAERQRLFDLGALEDLCARSPGRHGVRPLRALLAQPQFAPAPTRSELERLFLDLCRDKGLPAPAVNVWVEGFEVDALWADRRLVVELDGYAFHGDRSAFERDRLRDAELQLAGYRVLRVTYRRLRAEPVEVAEAVRSLLSRRPPLARSSRRR